ncbi:MAG: hypothetical protein K8U57_24310 [Planctomycetes bacterium]|nr:hypothetical protein [Planctomycetota bacterium]
MRLFAVVLFVTIPTAAQAQPERYEVGRRLKSFEAAWEKFDDPTARERALTGLQTLTKQFFSLKLGEAGRSLDLATFALSADIGPSAARQFVWSLSAFPETRLVDGNAKELSVTIQPFYPVKGDIPKSLELQLWFTNKDVVTVKPEKFPITVKVPLPPMGEAKELDRKLYFLADGAKELRPVAIGLSQIADLKPRLAALKKAADGWEQIETLEQATVRDRVKPLLDLAAGEVSDTDIPAAAWLANAESMLDGKPFFTWRKRGQYWLSVPLGGKKTVACRVFIPANLDKDKPVPVVFAFHGFGVGANTFFEAYGAGQIVKECDKRGWVLIAPESGLGYESPPVEVILEKLAERYPLDPKRVFLVGHSLGGVRTFILGMTGKFTAVAVLAGGGKLPMKSEAIAMLPVFIGVGDKDTLGLTGAKSLHKSLVDMGAKGVTYKEYVGLEHLTIVREALPDVFAMFDKAAKK